ncbi:MAG: hypothetical protein AAGC92_16660 [Pseudomonadota bacterium]
MSGGKGKDTGNSGRGKAHQNDAASAQPKKGSGKQSKWAPSAQGGVSRSILKDWAKAGAKKREALKEKMNLATAKALGLV